MPDWKVLIADSLAPDAAHTLEEGGAQVADRAGISAEELLEEIGDAHGLIVRSRTKVTPQVLAAAPLLKVVGRAGVGVDNIDLEAARAQDVAVVNTPTSTGLAVAEHTMALLLALTRQITQADTAMKAGGWPKKELKGVELSGKALGIVGVGNIGAKVAERAAAFGMRIIGYDPYLDDDTLRQRSAEPLALDVLYAQADVITFHLPLTDETRHMVDAASFAKMKSGVYILQAARGGVIDEDALLAALESGQVAGAGLDVFEQEPPGDSKLVAHLKVVATPHIGAQTAEAQVRAAVDVAEEILNALNDQPLRWRVN